MWIVQLALRRPYTFIVLAIFILIAGVLSILRTPKDIFPDINIPVCAAIWNFTGMPAEEVQRVLLEEAGVAGIAGAAFGAEGKNYLRFSLVSATHLLEDALERIQRVSSRWRAAVAR